MKAFLLKENSRGIDQISPYSRLLQDRKIFLTEEVNAETANDIISQLLTLELENPDEDIELYINSPGGEVRSGLAIYDVINNLSCTVNTVCIGTAASMGAILFLSGKERTMYEHSQIMIHDPLINGLSGTRKVFELEKEVQQLLTTREILGKIISQKTGQSLRKVYSKTKEDCYLNAEEALNMGIATNIKLRKAELI